jgi:hypothetical protein
MIHHVVLFRFRSDAEAERVAAAGEALLAMRGRIPEVRGVSWGPNLAPSAGEWPWVLVVECDDMDAVRRYADHPVHRDVVERHVAPIRDARLAIDVER